MFVTMEDDALKVCLLFCAVCLHFFFKYIYIFFSRQNAGRWGVRCQCPRGFEGPRCQQTTRSFWGKGWAWYPPLELCEDSHLSIGKNHALKKYDQFAINTSCFWGKYWIEYYTHQLCNFEKFLLQK